MRCISNRIHPELQVNGPRPDGLVAEKGPAQVPAVDQPEYFK